MPKLDNDTVSTRPGAKRLEADSSRERFGDRFRAELCLKRGPRGRTFRGVDEQTGRAVIIKTAPVAAINSAGQLRLEHEAGVLRQIGNSYLSSLLELGKTPGEVYLVTPFVKGVDLRIRLQRGPLSLSETLTVGCQLAASLESFHEAGILHRDVKPGNLIVNDDGALESVTLIDFGFAHSSELDPRLKHELVGTARYVSPEQAGLLDHGVCEASDLYSAGVVLFECLAGRPPFVADEVGDLLRLHLTQQPPVLRNLAAHVPGAVNEVIQRLLRKDPRDRYQTAAAVRHDLEEIRQQLNAGSTEPSVVVGRLDRRRTLTEPAFVGRTKELNGLGERLAEAARGKPSLAILEAESGVGKTRLLAELAQRSRQSGAWVLRGQGQYQVGQRPFQLMDGIASDVVSECEFDADFRDELSERLGIAADDVCEALPQLSQTLGGKLVDSAAPQALGQERRVQAVSALLDRLGTRERPAVVILDDCQWADELAVNLLRHWSERHRVKNASTYVMLVVAYRSEDVSEDHGLLEVRPTQRFRLRPLSSEQMKRLATSMAGKLPDQALQTIERLSEGSPFMASAVLRGLVESNALRPTEQGWEIDDRAMSDIQSSRHAAAFLTRRLQMLPEGLYRLLEVAAVLGKDFAVDMAAAIADQSGPEAMNSLRTARQRHLIWELPGNRWAFVHDRLRQSLLEGLSAEDRREFHHRAAEYLQQHNPTANVDLAYHFDAAGDSRRAFPFALAAAVEARRRHALEIAEQGFYIAERGAESVDAATRSQVAEGLGGVLMLRGKYRDADDQLKRAHELAVDDVSKARILGEIGELAFKRGDVEKACTVIESALLTLGCRIPRSYHGIGLATSIQAAVQVLHTILPRSLVARRQLRGDPDELLVIRLFSRLSYAYWYARGPVPTYWAHLTELNRAERYRDETPELAQAYSEHAPGMSMIPWTRRGVEYARKSRDIRRRLHDRWGEGQSLHFLGIVLYAASQYQQCIETCRQAIKLLEDTGDQWEVNIARYQIAASHYRLGDLRTAVQEAKLIHASGRELGDVQASGISLDVWAMASQGRVPADVIRAEREHSNEDRQRTAQVLLAEALQRLFAGDAEAAVQGMEEACELTRQAGLRSTFVAPLRPWLVTALRHQWEQCDAISPKRRDALLRQAAKTARRGLALAGWFRNDLPHALREMAMVRSMQGRYGQARHYFQRSLAVAQEQGAMFDYAQTLQLQGRIGLEVGWPDAEEQLETASQQLQQMTLAPEEPAENAPTGVPEPVTLSLADRFDNVLESGRSLASKLSRDEILAEVDRAARLLLRAERCVVCLVDATPDGLDSTPVAGHVDESISQELLYRAIASGHTELLVEGAPRDPSDSVVLSGVRSALCAPISSREGLIACLYMSHREVIGLFGEDELRLAGFICTIAGAALDNAAGFMELQHLNTNLERLVAERTADAEARAEELKRSNEELEQFAYVASHDLREPLRTVTSFCQLLESRYAEQIGEDGREFIEFAVDGARRMQRLIDDLLTYSRVSTRAQPFEPVDVGELLEIVRRNLAVAIEECSASITNDALPVVPGDPTQLTQLFQNLVANALKFRRDEAPRVHVSATPVDGYWEIAVADNGIGMSRPHFERVFLIFQRLHSRDEYEGTGIGLSICKKTVQRHGGEIWIESEPGVGSTFHFTLPMEKAGVDASAATD